MHVTSTSGIFSSKIVSTLVCSLSSIYLLMTWWETFSRSHYRANYSDGSEQSLWVITPCIIGSNHTLQSVAKECVVDPVSFRSSVEQGFCATYLYVWVAVLYPVRNRYVYSVWFVDSQPFHRCELQQPHGFFIHFYPMVFLVSYMCKSIRNQ